MLAGMKTIRRLLALTFVLLPVLAFASDGGVAAVSSPVAAPVVTAPSAPGAILQGLLNAFQSRNWTMVAALLLIGVVALIRYAAPKLHGATGAWLNSNRGGSTLVLVCGILGAIGTALFGGAHISAQLILSGVLVGVMASGGWNVVWDLLSPCDKKPDLTGPVPMVTPSPSAPTPVDPPKIAMLLPFLFIAGASLLSCAAFGPEFGACMAGKGIQVASGLPGKVNDILSNSNQADAAVTALEGLVGTGVSDIVNCWLTAHPVVKGAAVSPKLLVGRAAAEAFLAKKK